LIFLPVQKIEIPVSHLLLYAPPEQQFKKQTSLKYSPLKQQPFMLVAKNFKKKNENHQ